MRIYLKWFFHALANIPMTLWAWLMAGHYARKTLDNWMLPDEYRNYQTPDAFQNGMGFGGLGKGGDRDFYEERIGLPLMRKTIEQVSKEWMRRNTYHGGRAWKWGIPYGDEILPLDGVDGAVYHVMKEGCNIATLIRVSGTMTFDDHSGEGHYHYVMYDEADKAVAFMYYRNIHFTLPFLGQKRLRLKLGWDLWNMWWPVDTPRMFVCSVGIHRQK